MAKKDETKQAKQAELTQAEIEQAKAEADKAKKEAEQAKPKADKTKAPTGKKYQVNWTLNHDGKKYQQGDTVELSAEQAKPLLDCGVIE